MISTPWTCRISQALSSQTGATGVYVDDRDELDAFSFSSDPWLLFYAVGNINMLVYYVSFDTSAYFSEHNLHYLTQAAADHDRTL
jgi:hypothetical protein